MKSQNEYKSKKVQFLYAIDLGLDVNVKLASVERDREDSDSGEK